MKDKCYAKINLSLNVKERKDDGYHLIESIMVPIAYYDEIEIDINDIDIFNCNDKDLKYDKHNTIYKMINSFKEKYHISDKYKINLIKNIPSKAGLAGGSADAATTLKILMNLYHKSLSKEEIKELCLSVGSDVLFTYYNKPALVKGIGDKLEFFKIKDKYHLLLFKPLKGVSTKEAYDNLNLEKCPHPDINHLKDLLIEGKDIKGYLDNSLEESAIRLCPQIKEIMTLLKDNGATNIRMSGSGSSVFVISKNKKEIDDLYHKFKNNIYLLKQTTIL